MKNYDDLFRQLKYPQKPKMVEVIRVGFNSNAEWGEAIDVSEIEFEKQKQKYVVELEKFHKKQNQLDAEFWDELVNELGWNALPKSICSALQSMAWETGHANGYMEVYNVASDYACVVNAILKELNKTEKNNV